MPTFKSFQTDANFNSSDKSAVTSNANLGSQASSGSSLDKQSLKINLTASSEAQIDCSSAGAKFTTEILNSGVDVLVCLQDILDMPPTSPRFQEKYLCDDTKKFGPVPKTWKYELGNRRWVIPVEVLKNHSFLVPGSYTLFVKDNQGKIYQSSAAVVKKSGSSNCNDTSGTPGGNSSSSGQCHWSALAIGGSALNPPKSACTESIAWSKAIDGNGIEQTCMCATVAQPADPPLVFGYIAAPVYGQRHIEGYEFLTGNGAHQPSAVNNRECIVGTTYNGYTTCSDELYGESPNRYRICESWTQLCTSTPN